MTALYDQLTWNLRERLNGALRAGIIDANATRMAVLAALDARVTPAVLSGAVAWVRGSAPAPCPHEWAERVAPDGADFCSCNLCGAHWNPVTRVLS